MSLWNRLHHLFEEDSEEGSLPDIFVDNLASSEVVAVYEWVMSQCQIYGDPVAWNIAESRDVPIKTIPRPAQAVVEGTIEVFRHGLFDLSFGGHLLPELTIFVLPNGIEFDYRRGEQWNEAAVNALFAFLAAIQEIVPNAVISQANEGQGDHRNEVFSGALTAYLASNGGLKGRGPGS